MSRAIMLSIRPEWCEKIASGKKTVEVRKTRPRLETPFKCYIYCVKAKQMTSKNCFLGYSDGLCFDKNGKIRFGFIHPELWPVVRMNGKVVGEFVCDTFVTDKTFGHDALFNAAACMSESDAAAYATVSPLYGWHISALKIYDKPKELSDFVAEDREQNKNCRWKERVYQNPDYNPTGGLIYGGVYCRKKSDWCDRCHKKHIERPPQSWCYVEEN